MSGGKALREYEGAVAAHLVEVVRWVERASSEADHGDYENAIESLYEARTQLAAAEVQLRKAAFLAKKETP